MDVRQLIANNSFDYGIAYAFFAEHSTHNYLINLLKDESDINRDLLVKQIHSLLAKDSELAINDQVITKLKDRRQLQAYQNEPIQIQNLVKKSNYTYALLRDVHSKIKALAFQGLSHKPKGVISLSEALELMNAFDASGNAALFSLVYVSNKGGIKTYNSCVLNKNSKKISLSYKQANNKNSINKKRWWKQTDRRILLPETNEIVSVRINQLIVFNNLEIVWA